MKKFLISILLSLGFLLSAPYSYASSNADLVVTSFHLTNASGVAKTTFAPNEAIYMKFTIKNQGTQTAFNRYTSAGHIWSQVYGHKPSTVATATESDIGVWIRNYNNITPGQVHNYGSYNGGTNQWAFEGAKFFKKGTAGTYTARVFVNYDRLAEESNYSNNQRTLTYTIGGGANPTPTPTKAPTPTPTKVPSPTPTPAPLQAGATCDGRNMTIHFGPAPTGTVRWAIRIDDPTNGWNSVSPNTGDTLINDHPGPSYTRGVNGGQWYFWWIHPLNNANGALGTSSGQVYCKVGKPGNLRMEKSGTTVTLRWDSVPGAFRYAIRVNDTSNGWNSTTPLANDRIKNDITGTSYQFTSGSGKHYTWWIHAVDMNGFYSDPTVSEFNT